MDENKYRNQRGSAMVMALLLSVVGVVVMGAIMTMTMTTTNQTTYSWSTEAAYQTAEAGVSKAIFELEADISEPGEEVALGQFMEDSVGRTFSGTLGKGSFVVTLKDPTPGDGLYTLESVGSYPGGASRTVTAILLGSQKVRALDYALFGNYIHFDNHNKVNFGMTLVTSVFSNSGIKIDPGISIAGTVQAVQYIQPSDSSGSLSPTSLSPAGQQGDPDPSPVVASAPVEQAQPAPAVLPFPSFDFSGMQTLAAGAKRDMSSSELNSLIDNAFDYARSLGCGGKKDKGGDECESELNVLTPLPPSSYPGGVQANSVPVNVIHHYYSDPRDGRFVRVPTASQPERLIFVGSPDGIATGPSHTYEVIIEGDPLPENDSVIYVDGSVDISLEDDELLRVEGSLIVDGEFSLSSGAEILAWENRVAPWYVPVGDSLYDFASSLAEVGPLDGFYDNGTKKVEDPCGGEPCPPAKDIRYSKYPAIAANGKFKIGSGNGPAHIEGVIYTVEESHIHRSNLEGAVYVAGCEIADVVHNCEFFSFAYDPEARNTFALDSTVTGRAKLALVGGGR